MKIRIHGGTIVAIEAARGATGHARFVLPGLVDMHVHTPFAFDQADRLLFALLDLSHGVTAVRDTGNFDDSILALRSETALGHFPGPRIFACGPLLDGEPSWWPGSRVVRDRAEARTVVDELANRGVDCIKAYYLLSADALAGIREAAEAHQLPVIGHVAVRVPFESAHLADVQHLTGVPPSPPLRRRSEFFGWWSAAWRDVDPARMDFIVKTSVEQKIAHTSTIVVWQAMARALRGSDAAALPGLDLVPSVYPDVVWRLPPEIMSPAFAADMDAAIPKMKELVRRLHAAGVRLHTGTDVGNPNVVPGLSLWNELGNFVDAGLSPEEALEAATRAPGESLGVEGLGTIAENAPADFIVLGKDPTADLANLSTIEAVVAAGRVYTRADLDAALERHRTYFNGALYRASSHAFARGFGWVIGRRLREDIEIH
jgi:hypothetical protein